MRKTLGGARAIALVLVLTPVVSHAHSSILEVGDKIRLRTLEVRTHVYGVRTHQSDRVAGTVVRLDRQVICLMLAESADTLAVRHDEIVSVEKSFGMHTRRGRGKFLGMVTGAVLGAGIGVALAYTPGDAACQPSSIGDPGCAGLAVPLGLTGFIVGAWAGRKIGGGIGDGFTYEKWERLRGWGPGTLRVGVGGQSRDPVLHASVAVRF